MNHPLDLTQFQEILRLLEKDISPEGQVLQGVLTDLLETDPCGFRKKAPQGYTAQQCYLLLVHSAMLNTSLYSASLDLVRLRIKTPTGEAVLNQLKAREYKKLMENMDVLFQRQWERVDANVRDFLSSQLIISLDMVQHPYYGNVEKAQVVGGKRKKSASRHHTYGSAKLLWEGHGLTVAVRMLHKGQERYAWAKEILAQAARYGRPLLFLADGGFWIKELLWDWAQGGYAFIVHVGSGVTGTEIPKNLQREAELTGEIETTKYTILLDKPKRELTVRLIAWSEKNGKNRCIGVPSYLDDLPAEWLVSLYRSRFGIETGYRSWNLLRPRTTSRDRNIRYTLVATSVALYNAYSLARTGTRLPEAPQSRHWKRLISLVRQQASASKKARASSTVPSRSGPKKTSEHDVKTRRTSLYVLATPTNDRRLSLGSWAVKYHEKHKNETEEGLRVRILPKRLPPPKRTSKPQYKEICTSGPLSKKFLLPTFYLTIKGLLSTWFRALITLSNWIKQIADLSAPSKSRPLMA